MGRAGNFSYEGKRALFDYLEELENSTGEQIELDVIALCVDYAEHDSALDCYKEYSDEEEEISEEEAKEWLEEHTTVISASKGSVIVQNF